MANFAHDDAVAGEILAHGNDFRQVRAEGRAPRIARRGPGRPVWLIGLTGRPAHSFSKANNLASKYRPSFR